MHRNTWTRKNWDHHAPTGIWRPDPKFGALRSMFIFIYLTYFSRIVSLVCFCSSLVTPETRSFNQIRNRSWGSHTGGYEEFYLLEHNAVYPVEIQRTLRKEMSPPANLAHCLLMLVYCFAYSSNPKMEEICSSEIPAYFQRTTRRRIPNKTLHIYSIKKT
jgi:hypothetical protein